jgi:hypothetical protein
VVLEKKIACHGHALHRTNRVYKAISLSLVYYVVYKALMFFYGTVIFFDLRKRRKINETRGLEKPCLPLSLSESLNTTNKYCPVQTRKEKKTMINMGR